MNKSLFSNLAWLWGFTFLLGDVYAQSPSIVTSPVSQAVPEGGTGRLSVTVTGALPITYAWRRNTESTNYYKATLDSTTSSVVLSNMTPSQACYFSLNISNAFGNAPGRQAILAVLSSGMETNGFALTIRGLTNSVWRIDYSTNFDSSSWSTLTNLTIPRTPPFFKYVDLAATNLNRFYRVVPTVF